jgi:hypothetical protein
MKLIKEKLRDKGDFQIRISHGMKKVDYILEKNTKIVPPNSNLDPTNKLPPIRVTEKNNIYFLNIF